MLHFFKLLLFSNRRSTRRLKICSFDFSNKSLHLDAFSGSGIVAVNVLYFKGQWLNEMMMLNEVTGEPTSNRDFYTTNGNYQVPMMTNEDDINYGVLPEFDATFVEIPFKVNNFSSRKFIHFLFGRKTKENVCHCRM